MRVSLRQNAMCMAKKQFKKTFIRHAPAPGNPQKKTSMDGCQDM
jgi:hypothetical protein